MSDQLLLWLDLETTGLDPATGAILEIACVVTSIGGERDGDVFTRIVHHVPWSVPLPIALMHGGPDGLLSRCRDSSHPVIGEADTEVCAWLGDRSHLILAGSSIHFDRRWIEHYMPKLAARLHYRMLDVRSVLMTLAAAGRDLETEKVVSMHRALPDMEHALAMYRRVLAEVSR